MYTPVVCDYYINIIIIVQKKKNNTHFIIKLYTGYMYEHREQLACDL